MTLEWFKNPDHVVYVEKEKFVDNFAKETGIPNLRKEIDEFEARPTAFKLGIFLRVNHSVLIGIVHLLEFGSRIAKTPGMALLDLLRSQLATGGRSSHVCLWFRILWRFGRRRILGYETSAGKGENQCECE